MKKERNKIAHAIGVFFGFLFVVMVVVSFVYLSFKAHKFIIKDAVREVLQENEYKK